MGFRDPSHNLTRPAGNFKETYIQSWPVARSLSIHGLLSSPGSETLLSGVGRNRSHWRSSRGRFSVWCLCPVASGPDSIRCKERCPARPSSRGSGSGSAPGGAILAAQRASGAVPDHRAAGYQRRYHGDGAATRGGSVTDGDSAGTVTGNCNIRYAKRRGWTDVARRCLVRHGVF